MNLRFITLRTVLLTVAVCSLHLTAARATSTPEEAATWTKAADNKIYAQQLVNQTMAAEPDLLVMGLHGVKPGAKEQRMIACNLDRIGKHDDEDDIGVATEHKTICAPNQRETNKFEVLIPMKDASGKTLNAAIGFVFKYKAGDSEVELHAKASEMRDAMAKKIPSFEALFAPVK